MSFQKDGSRGWQDWGAERSCGNWAGLGMWPSLWDDALASAYDTFPCSFVNEHLKQKGCPISLMAVMLE
jgi:hypothetical protein